MADQEQASLGEETPKDPEPISSLMDDPLIGKTVGNYRIKALLGVGGMGSVYRATHPGLGRTAAIKILRSELSEDPRTVERFLREAKATNQIKHPGIVDIFDLGAMPDGSCYMVMELLEGESLEQYANTQGALPESTVLKLGCDILDILSAAHQKGVIHRDLKPANIFLEKRKEEREKRESNGGDSSSELFPISYLLFPRILDFGIAKLLASENLLGATADGALLGTPRYMPPEQARSPSTIDTRADFYSLGVILYELATGSPIFEARSSIEMLQKHKSQTPIPPRTLRPQLSKEFEDAILCALSKDKNQRFTDCESFISALQAAQIKQRIGTQEGIFSTLQDPASESAEEFRSEMTNPSQVNPELEQDAPTVVTPAESHLQAIERLSTMPVSLTEKTLREPQDEPPFGRIEDAVTETSVPIDLAPPMQAKEPKPSLLLPMLFLMLSLISAVSVYFLLLWS